MTDRNPNYHALVERIVETYPDDANAARPELFQDYYAQALKVAKHTLRIGGKAACVAAEEVAWDGLTKAIFEKAHQYDTSRPFLPWMAACVRNTAYDRLRDNLRHRHTSLDSVVVPSRVNAPSKAELLSEACETVRNAINDLPYHERTLFVRFYCDNDSVAALAASFDRASATIRVRLSQLKRRVLSSLGSIKLTNAQIRLLLSLGESI